MNLLVPFVIHNNILEGLKQPNGTKEKRLFLKFFLIEFSISKTQPDGNGHKARKTREILGM